MHLENKTIFREHPQKISSDSVKTTQNDQILSPLSLSGSKKLSLYNQKKQKDSTNLLGTLTPKMLKME